MKITLPAFKINIISILLFLFLYWLLWIHVLCSCSTITLREFSEMLRGFYREGFVAFNKVGPPASKKSKKEETKKSGKVAVKQSGKKETTQKTKTTQEKPRAKAGPSVRK